MDFKIQFAVVVSHGTKHTISDLFFSVMENRSQMIFLLVEALSAGAMKGLKGLSWGVEGDFTQGMKMRATTRTPRPRLLPGGVILPFFTFFKLQLTVSIVLYSFRCTA